MALPRASGLKERLSQVYGEEFLEGLAEAVKEEGGLRMHAFFSKPGNWRNTRSHQFVFLNGRPIREPFAAHAVEGAYEGNFSDRPGDRHPVFFLFLDADPRRVDFNVHPAKREVRFEDKDAVYRLITKAVREAVREFATRGVNPAKETVLTTYAVEASQARPVEPAVFEAQPLAYRAEPSYIYLGEAFVAFSDGGGITLLDHHAAHERVLYEKFLKGVELRSTRLLFPRQVKLSAREYRAVIGQTEMLCDFGMEVEDFGADTVIVRALPEAMLDADLRGLLSDVAGQIMEGRGPGQSIREAVATRMACHGSIRGSRVLGREGLAALLEDLEKTDSPGQCPHGRPTRVHYSLDELKKLFGRK
jgi:DNA mismatch repair protein MutL